MPFGTHCWLPYEKDFTVKNINSYIEKHVQFRWIDNYWNICKKEITKLDKGIIGKTRSANQSIMLEYL